MADTYIQGSFAFRCTDAERALIGEAAQAASGLSSDLAHDLPSAAFRTAFPPTRADDAWSGFLDIFPDPDFPALGADFAGESCPGEPGRSIVSFASMSDFQPEAVAMLVQRCCPHTLGLSPIGFEWAVSCSKPRIDEFGGGWCAIFADRIEIEATGTALARALDNGIL